MQKGQAITSTELTASTAAISIPQGLVAMAVDISGAQNLAGYLQPGSHVDIYANITKMSAGGAPESAPTIPIPCTELAMTNIQVMDVSSTSPSSTGRRLQSVPRRRRGVPRGPFRERRPCCSPSRRHRAVTL